MLQLRIRACHVHGQFVAGDNRRPAFTLARRAARTRSATSSRIVLPPASFVHEQEKVKERWPAAVRFIEEHGLNEFFAEDADDIGIVVQGGSYNTLLRALERLGLADVYGNSQRPALRDERRLPGDRQRGAALLRRQARGADGRGRASPTSSSRTSRRILRQAGVDDRAARQGHAADGRRIHRRRGAEGRARVPRALRPRSSRRRRAGARSQGVPRCIPLEAAGRQRASRGRRAFAPAARSGRSSPR